MALMTIYEAIPVINHLNKKWGVFTGSLPEILSQVRAGIKNELRFALSGRSTASRELVREMRAELILCGKINVVLKSHVGVIKEG